MGPGLGQQTDADRRAPARSLPGKPQGVGMTTPTTSAAVRSSSLDWQPAEPPRGRFGEIRRARRRGQQKGYVHRQGNWWYLAYREDALDVNGKIVRVRRNEKIADAKEVSKREAQRLAREILTKVDEQATRPASLLTVSEFIEGRFKPDVIWALKHAGQKHYGYILGKHVVPGIGQQRLRDVTSDHVQSLVKMKIEAGYSVQTAVHIRNAISAVFN